MKNGTRNWQGENMKNGCKVKVKVDDKWRAATLLNHTETVLEPWAYMVGIGEPHHFNYKETFVGPDELKEFVELSEETAAHTHAQELLIALDLIQETLAALLPDEKVEVKDGSIFGYYGAVTLDPVVSEHETIGKVIERATWQVTTWKSYPATRHQPEDVCDSPIGKPTGYNQAVQLFIETLFKLKANDYWQAKYDAQYAQSLEGW